tara:strand:- start:38 stop:427 length:390 start_codon:yes stop_codon:yes gene_type:complete
MIGAATFHDTLELKLHPVNAELSEKPCEERVMEVVWSAPANLTSGRSPVPTSVATLLEEMNASSSKQNCAGLPGRPSCSHVARTKAAKKCRFNTKHERPGLSKQSATPMSTKQRSECGSSRTHGANIPG